MGKQPEPAPDVVIFFDANMPNIDRCDDNCADDESTLCPHRFSFRARVIFAGKAIQGFDDFRVLRHFLGLVKKCKDWQGPGRKPVFILVTKDHNFLKDDAPRAYEQAVQARTNEIKLEFGEDYVSDGDYKIFIRIIGQKGHWPKRDDCLRSTIDDLNRFWDLRSPQGF